jgi:hypothetical protein
MEWSVKSANVTSLNRLLFSSKDREDDACSFLVENAHVISYHQLRLDRDKIGNVDNYMFMELPSASKLLKSKNGHTDTEEYDLASRPLLDTKGYIHKPGEIFTDDDSHTRVRSDYVNVLDISSPCVELYGFGLNPFGAIGVPPKLG